MKDGDDARPFTPIISLPTTSEPGPDSSTNSEELELSDSDIAFLSEFVDPTYLDQKAITKINSRFCDDSSVQLKSFLNSEISRKIFDTTKIADCEDLLGMISLVRDINMSSNAICEVSCEWQLSSPHELEKNILMEITDSLPLLMFSISLLSRSFMSLRYCNCSNVFIT